MKDLESTIIEKNLNLAKLTNDIENLQSLKHLNEQLRRQV